MKITLTRNDFDNIERDAIRIGKFLDCVSKNDNTDGLNYAKESLLSIVERTCGGVGLNVVTTALERRKR